MNRPRRCQLFTPLEGLDKSLDFPKTARFQRTKAVSTIMTNLGATLLYMLVSAQTISVYAHADQNVFTGQDERGDDTVRTSTVADDTPPSTPSSNFKIRTGRSEGTGRGGDRLLELESTSKMSFFPRDIALSTVLIERMNKYFGKCVSDAAKAAGMGTVTDINVSHMGGYVNRRINNGSKNPSRSWSLHSSGRALDIGRIDVVANGKTYRVPMTKASHDGRNGREEKAFYRAFTKCWSTNNKNNCGSKSLLDCNYNSKHHDHVHIALPFCPRKRGIASE